MRTAAYLRYSSDQQRDASIRDQLRNIETYCDRQGWQKPLVFQDEAVSGARSDRPGYRALIKAARDRQFEVLLVDDLSRLSRDHIEAAQAVRLLKFLGVRLIGVSDGLDTARNGYKLETGMRGLMAELYLDDLAEKTHRGLMGQALDGYSAGGLPYGYASVHDGHGHRRVILEEQAQWVRWMFDRYIRGHSPRAIAAELNALGIPSARGKTWCLTAIYPDAKHVGILGNPIYNGRQIWNRTKWIKDPSTGRRKRILRPESEWVITEHPELKIVDDDTWSAARDRALKTRARTARQRENLRRASISGGRGPKYLFSGLLRCACCGSSYVVVDRYRYGCSAHKDRGSAACSNSIKVPRDAIERTLLAGIKEELLSDRAYRAFESEVRRLLKTAQPDIGEARRAAAKAQAEVDNIIGAIRQGIITPATKQALEEAEGRLDAAKRRIKEIEAWQPTQMLPRAKQIYRGLAERLERIEDIADAREALRSILGEEIKLVPENGVLWAELKGGCAALSQITVVAGAGYVRYLTPLRWRIWPPT
jgi:site-specific DNA recombinase